MHCCIKALAAATSSLILVVICLAFQQKKCNLTGGEESENCTIRRYKNYDGLLRAEQCWESQASSLPLCNNSLVLDKKKFDYRQFLMGSPHSGSTCRLFEYTKEKCVQCIDSISGSHHQNTSVKNECFKIENLKIHSLR